MLWLMLQESDDGYSFMGLGVAHSTRVAVAFADLCWAQDYEAAFGGGVLLAVPLLHLT